MYLLNSENVTSGSPADAKAEKWSHFIHKQFKCNNVCSARYHDLILIRSTTGLGFYAASKRALEALHEGEAPLLWHEWGIKMTLLECGNIITNTEHMVDRLDVCSRS